MAKLEIEYYISKDEEVVYAVEQKYGLYVAIYNTSQGYWTLAKGLNESVLLHEDDIYAIGENGALTITKNKSPEEILSQIIQKHDEVETRVDKTIKEVEEIIKANENRFK